MSKITYKGQETALSAGRNATLSCDGKAMAGDVMAVFDGPGRVSYQGDETKVDGGQTATLPCAGMVMGGDVVVYADYSISYDLTGCYLPDDGLEYYRIEPGAGKGIWIHASDGYKLLADEPPTVTNATLDMWYTDGDVVSQGMVVFLNPTGNVTVKLAATRALEDPSVFMIGSTVSIAAAEDVDAYKIFAGDTEIGEVSG